MKLEKTNSAIFSILDTSAFGGAEQYMFSHLRYLCNHGFTMILATNNKKVKEIMLSRLSADEKKRFIIIRAPYRLDAIGNWKGLIKFFLALPRALVWCYLTLRRLRKTYDKVICLWPGYSDRSVFSPIANHFNLPLIWIEFGTLETLFKRNFGFPKPLFQIPSRYPKHLVTSSLYTKTSIVKNSSFTDNDVSIVYPGTNLFLAKELGDFKMKAEKWKKQEQLQKTSILGVVGRLAHENEIDMVIKGFALFVKNHKEKNAVLLIIGDGPVRKELEGLSEKLGMKKNIKFCGFVDETQKRVLLSACDVFIFPRAWVLDGFGMTTIEAMALGLPVLTTDFGPQIEIVTHKKEGFRYKPHDSEDLARFIHKMLSLPPGQRKTMGKAGLERVKDFSEELSNKKMFSVIRHHTY